MICRKWSLRCASKRQQALRGGALPAATDAALRAPAPSLAPDTGGQLSRRHSLAGERRAS